MDVQNLDVDQGADFFEDFLWADEDTLVPVDLTGFTALMEIRTGPGTIIALTSPGDITVTLGGAAGTIDLAIPGAKTAELVQAEYHYDVLLTDGSGVKYLPVGGTVNVNLAISVAS